MPFHIRKFKTGWKVYDDKGKPYSIKPLSKKRATAQLRALYANEADVFRGSGYAILGKNIVLDGDGFFSDVFGTLKKATEGVISRVRGVTKGIRTNYPPSVRSLINKYRDYDVIKLIIRRKPIVSLIDKALNFISLGKWNQTKDKLKYDNLFHLSLIAVIRAPRQGGAPSTNNKYIIVEKNEVINIKEVDAKELNTQPRVSVPINKPLKFGEMLDNGQALAGDDFFKYNAFSNNCQMFINGILNANQLNTKELNEFIMQDVDAILKGLPSYMNPFAKTLTDIAGLANVALEGEGASKNVIKKYKMRGGVTLVGRMMRGGVGTREQLRTVVGELNEARSAGDDEEALRLAFIAIDDALDEGILEEDIREHLDTEDQINYSQGLRNFIDRVFEMLNEENPSTEEEEEEEDDPDATETEADAEELPPPAKKRKLAGGIATIPQLEGIMEQILEIEGELIPERNETRDQFLTRQMNMALQVINEAIADGVELDEIVRFVNAPANEYGLDVIGFVDDIATLILDLQEEEEEEEEDDPDATETEPDAEELPPPAKKRKLDGKGKFQDRIKNIYDAETARFSNRTDIPLSIRRTSSSYFNTEAKNLYEETKQALSRVPTFGTPIDSKREKDRIVNEFISELSDLASLSYLPRPKGPIVDAITFEDIDIDRDMVINSGDEALRNRFYTTDTLQNIMNTGARNPFTREQMNKLRGVIFLKEDDATTKSKVADVIPPRTGGRRPVVNIEENQRLLNDIYRQMRQMERDRIIIENAIEESRMVGADRGLNILSDRLANLIKEYNRLGELAESYEDELVGMRGSGSIVALYDKMFGGRAVPLKEEQSHSIREIEEIMSRLRGDIATANGDIAARQMVMMFAAPEQRDRLANELNEVIARRDEAQVQLDRLDNIIRERRRGGGKSSLERMALNNRLKKRLSTVEKETKELNDEVKMYKEELNKPAQQRMIVEDDLIDLINELIDKHNKKVVEILDIKDGMKKIMDTPKLRKPFGKEYAFYEGEGNDIVVDEKRLAELNKAIPSKAKWEGSFKKRGAKPTRSYEEFVANAKENNRKRATRDLKQEAESQRIGADTQARLEQYKKDIAKDPGLQQMACKMTKEGRPFKGNPMNNKMTAKECQDATNKYIDYLNEAQYEGPLGKVVKGLKNVADFALDSGLAKAVGVPDIVSDAYKKFGPDSAKMQYVNYTGNGSDKFAKQLKKLNITPKDYLKKARAAANKAGYDGRALEFANDGEHKLMIYDDKGNAIKFGKAGMMDFILWKHSNPSVAKARRENYLKRSGAIKGDWKDNKFSANNLARRITWIE